MAEPTDREPSRSDAIWKGLDRVSIIGGVIALVILGAAAVGPTRRFVAGAVSDTSSWLYPDGWIALLGAALLALAAVLWLTNRRRRSSEAAAADALVAERARHDSKVAGLLQDVEEARSRITAVEAERDEAQRTAAEADRRFEPDRVAHDRRQLEALREALARELIDWIATHDFGGSFPRERVLPFHRFREERGAPEHRFLNPRLERLRVALHEAITRFSSAAAHYASAQPGNPTWLEVNPRSVMDMAPEGEQGELREARVTELNDVGDEVAAAYNELMGAAQEELAA